MTTWRVECGDCLELLRKLPSGSVDAVVTDPPYGIDFRGHAWDSFIPEWISEARRVSRCVLFTTWPNTIHAYPPPDWIGCWYREAACSSAAVGGFCHWSPVIVYGKPRWKCDSIKLHAISNSYSGDIGQPSPKPVRLMRWMVEASASVEATILDPFCGSGTTGVACVQTGRNFIGFEIDPRYCEIARRRISEAAPALFVPQSTAQAPELFPEARP